MREDTVAVFGPIPPDEYKQLSYSYVLPSTSQRFAIPIGQPVAEIDILLEDTVATAQGPGIETLGVQAIEQRRFVGFRTGSQQPGAEVTITFAPPPFSVQTLLPYLIALVALALVGGLVVALRRRPSAISNQPSVPER